MYELKVKKREPDTARNVECIQENQSSIGDEIDAWAFLE